MPKSEELFPTSFFFHFLGVFMQKVYRTCLMVSMPILIVEITNLCKKVKLAKEEVLGQAVDS